MRDSIFLYAVDTQGVIGVDDKLPFDIPEDLENFKTITNNKNILLGFKTYESILNNYTKDKSKFLENRVCYVLCSTRELAKQRMLSNIYTNVFFITQDFLKTLFYNKSFIVIGGSFVFESIKPYVSKYLVCHVEKDFVYENYRVLPTDTSYNEIVTKNKIKFFKVDYSNLDHIFSFAKQTSKTGVSYQYSFYTV